MYKALLLLHLSVFIAGFTGVFGRVISVDAFALTFYRVLIAAVLLYLLLRWRRVAVQFKHSDLRFLLIGLILSWHWVFFYASIKLANISIGVICLSGMAFFCALLEPVLLHRRFRVRELGFALVGISGIALIFNFDARFRAGITCGMVCALLAACYAIFNKRYGANAAVPERVIFWEMSGGVLGILMLMPVYLAFYGGKGLSLNLKDLLALCALASVCTVGLYLLQIVVLRYVSAFTMNLTYNLEPIYSIAAAMLLFSENRELNFSFYCGLCFIAMSVILQTASLLWESRAVT